MHSGEHVPAELKSLRQWVCWKYVDRAGKRTKPPFTSTGRYANHSNARTWTTYRNAVQSIGSNGLIGVGFVLTDADPYVAIDLDGCIDDAGNLSELAAATIAAIDSYTEISPSGRGVRIIVRAPGLRVGRRSDTAGVECYSHSRYVTITGNLVDGRAEIAERSAQLTDWLHRTLPEPTQQPAALPDDLANLTAAAQQQPYRARWAKLLAGNWQGLYQSQSEAELALCGYAVRLGADADLIDRLVRSSGLYREKWDQRSGKSTYGRNTINRAIQSTQQQRTPAPAPTGTQREEGEDPGLPVREFKPSPNKRHLSDIGNAERLKDICGEELRHVTLHNQWLIWDGTRWMPDTTDEIHRIAYAVIRTIGQEPARDTEERGRLIKWQLQTEQRKNVQAMIASAQPLLSTKAELLDADPWLLNVANGTLDLRTGELRPHRRELLCTKLAPVEYLPDARCPTWERFLLEIMDGDEELVSFLQRAIGYTLCGDPREHVLFMAHGSGRNGKSTMLQVLARMLGDYATSASWESFLANNDGRIRDDLADLAGARYVMASEAGEGRRLDEATIKQLTGGDRIRARHLYSRAFEYTPQFALWMACNHLPNIRGTDLGIWSRIRKIPFSVRITQPDPDLPARLYAELPGILAWAVRGCLEWQRSGLQPPAAVLAATDQYRSDMDQLTAWISECCWLNPEARAQSSQLYDSYKSWASSSGEYVHSLRQWTAKMEDRGLYRRKGGSSGVMFWHGIGLLETGNTGGTGDTGGFSEKSSSVSDKEKFSEKPPVPPEPPVSPAVSPAGSNGSQSHLSIDPEAKRHWNH